MAAVWRGVKALPARLVECPLRDGQISLPPNVLIEGDQTLKHASDGPPAAAIITLPAALMNPTLSSSASPTAQPRPVPAGMHRVTPHLVCAGAAAAIEFYRAAFGAEELLRVAAPGGTLMHARIRIGDSSVMLVDEFPECGCFGPKHLSGTPVVLHLYVENADAVAARAVAAGAKVILPVQDMFWGDRYGLLEDPFGHRWSVATHVRDLTADEIQEAARHATGCA